MKTNNFQHCIICNRSVKEWPMCFRGEPTCSDRCRKVMRGEMKPTERDWKAMQPGIHIALTNYWNDDRRQTDVPVYRGERE